MDATGKTLYSKWLYHLLRNSGKEATYIHILSPKGSVLRSLISDLRIGSEIKKRVMADVYKPKGSIARLSLVIILLDSFITYVTLLKPKRNIVICDRYFYDLMAIWACIKMIGFNTAYTFVKIMPRPAILFMLEAPPEVAYRRKGEHPKRFYEEQWIFYQGMKGIVKPIAIDTGRYSVPEVKRLIIEHIAGVIS
jgi:thymidylate kinase